MRSKPPLDGRRRRRRGKLSFGEWTIARLEESRRDGWDRVQAIGTLLVPVVLAIAAHQFTAQMKEAEIEAAVANANAQRQIEETRGDRD